MSSTPSSPNERIVRCPSCGKDAVFSKEKNPFRPFCSERCRILDLGEWASGGYAVPSNEKISIQDLPNSDESEDSES